MSDQWDFYQSLVDHEPASIFVNIGIAKDAPLAQFPTLAYLRVRMQKPRSDGLSSQDEYEALIALEDDISKAVEHDGQSTYVGRNTSSGNRDFYFYVRDSSVESAMQQAMANWPGYEFEIGTREDAEWSVYWRFLYPSEEDFQRISNRSVVDQLLKHGDHIEEPRKIDHLARFKTLHDRDGFLLYLRANGYDISQTNDASEAQLDVTFDRIGRPSQIDEVTIDLYRAALKHNGEYDGWGCSIVKK